IRELCARILVRRRSFQVIFPTATVDAGALRHNLAAVRRLAPASRILAVIKAYAYGHGMVDVARALAGADVLGVARIIEGTLLRTAGLRSSVVQLDGVFRYQELQPAVADDFEQVVH